VLLLLGAVCTLPGTWSLPLIDRDEPRFAEASREMMERGDYIVPYFNNAYRFDKPPFIYWLQVGSYRLLGVHDFSARLPSVLCTLATALLIYGFGTRLHPERAAEERQRAGFLAGVIYVTALQVMIHARASVADAAMVLGVTAMMWAGFEVLRWIDKNPRRSGVLSPWWWLLALALALGFLAKGPVAWLPLVALGIAAWQNGGWQSFRRSGLFGALLVGAAISACWGVPALLETNGEFFRIGIGKHVVERSVSAMEGHGASNILIYLLTIPFYLVMVVVFFLPWTRELPALWKSRTWRGSDGLLWWWIALVFVVFTLIKTKLPHYILPAYPALALLAGARFALEPALFARRWRLCATVAVVFSLLVGFVASPIAERVFLAKKIADTIGPRIASNANFGSLHYGEPSLVWYLRRSTHGWMLPLFPDFLETPGRFAIVRKSDFDSVFPNGTGDAELIEITGFNPAKFRFMTVVVVLPESAKKASVQ